MTTDSREVLTRVAPAPDLCLAFGPHPDQVADLRLPPIDGAARPVVLFIHGGFWRHEHDRGHTGSATAALAAAGYVVVVIEYRRVGGAGGWPHTFLDVVAAARSLPTVAASEARSRGRSVADGVVIVGHSAGGQLALWVAGELRGDRLGPVGVAGGHPGSSGAVAVVALAPVADLLRADELDLDAGAVADLLGGPAEQVAARLSQSDPMRRLPLRTPVVIVHGDEDRQVPVELSQRYAAAAQAHGDVVDLRILGGIDHFAMIDPLSPAWTAVLAAVEEASRQIRPVDGALDSR